MTLNGNENSALSPGLWETAPGIWWIGDRADARINLDVWRVENLLPLVGFELLIIQPVGQSLHWLCYSQTIPSVSSKADFNTAEFL